MCRCRIFSVLPPHRVAPLQGYTISFLITNVHLETMFKHKLIDFIIQFMEDIDKEINELKLAINARSRIVATSYLEAFVR